MHTLEELQKAFDASCQAEREAWAKVNGRLPGDAAFDSDLWEKWRVAVAALDVARERLLQALDDEGSHKK